jgi:hypothetical protein
MNYHTAGVVMPMVKLETEPVPYASRQHASIVVHSPEKRQVLLKPVISQLAQLPMAVRYAGVANYVANWATTQNGMQISFRLQLLELCHQKISLK